ITSAKTQNLPGGTYKVYAHYAGDGTNAPSDSSSVQVTVGKESSQTFVVVPTFDSQGKQLSGNATSIPYGSNYTIRMYVTNASATDTLTITPAATPLNFFSASNPLVDQTFYVQVQGSPNIVGGAAPTGTISIYDGTSVVSGPTAVNGYSGGTVGSPGFYSQMPVTLATGGDHSLTARYSGDASYAAATSTAQIVHPLYATTSTMTVSSTDINYPQSIAINATISTGQKTPVITGQINF